MAITQDTATVIGVFSKVQDAQEAIRQLEAAGFSKDEISLVANKESTGYEDLTENDRDELSSKTSDVVADAGIGAAIGGFGGLLLSIAGVAIPGIGPVLAAGPIAAALTGAGIGAAGGGLIGALTESGVPKEDATLYSESVRRGDVLVSVRAFGERADRAADILDEEGAVDVNDRVENWRSRGWSGTYDETARPYTQDELRRERGYYSDKTITEGIEGASHRTAEESKRLGHRMEEGARKAGNRIEEGWNELTGKPNRGAEKVKNRLEEAAQKTGHRTEEAAEEARNRAEEWTRRSRLYR